MAARPAKRKAVDPGPSSNSQRPVSAFAAARARQNPGSSKSSDQLHDSSDVVNTAKFAPSGLLNESSAQYAISHDDLVPVIAADTLMDIGDSDDEPDYILEPQQPSFLTASNEESNISKIISTWRPNGTNIACDSAAGDVLQLRVNDTVAFLGIFQFKVHQGAIDFYGAEIRQNDSRWRTAFVPSSHCIPAFKCLTPEARLEVMGSDSTIISLERLSPLYSRLWSSSLSNMLLEADARSFLRVASTEDDPLERQLQPLTVPVDWQKSLQSLVSFQGDVRVLITGPRGCGKSTFAKLACNRLLSRSGASRKTPTRKRVFILDLDPAHPQFSPPGQISLVEVSNYNFGPSFTHQLSPEGAGSHRIIRAHAIPKDAIQEYSTQYVECVYDLIACWGREKAQLQSPLIIDTPALVHAAGLEVLMRMEAQLPHSHHFYICHTDLTTPSVVLALEAVSMRSQAEFRSLACGSMPGITSKARTDIALQDMQAISYFHQAPEESPAPTWISEPLSSFSPMVVKYGDKNQGFIGLQFVRNWIEPDFIQTIITGGLVSVVETSDEDIISQYGCLPRTSNELPYFPLGSHGVVEHLHPQTSKLILVALIRSIEVSTRELHLLIPHNHELLLEGLDPKKLVLVYGCCDTPNWAHLEDAHYNDQGFSEQLHSQQSIGDVAISQQFELPPYVAKAEDMEKWGRLNMVRRVRKFQR